MFRLDYFSKKAVLAQSPQFYKQMMTGVFDRVYEVAPVFRAEKHSTSRHLNEYTSLDFEMGYIDGFEDIMGMETGFLQYTMKLLAEEYENELSILKIKLPETGMIPAVRFTDAKQQASERYGRPIRDPYDLEPEEEQLIGRYYKETCGSDFVFVTHYPAKKRPFYAMDDPEDPKYTLSFDLLFGGMEITTGGQRIHEIHMEEDAGKLIHDEWEECSLVDYNRSGVPLIEIVSEPDMRDAAEVIAYLEKLRLIIQYLGASDCKLQEGSMRADVNLSVRERGASLLGTRTEMKNLNSFKAITRAISGERDRQIELLEDGKEVIQDTRRWDDNKERSYPMRSKEDAQDYRYFPEPDLPPVMISEEWINAVKKRQPELRTEKMARYQKEYGLSEYDAQIITGTKRLADLFEETAKLCGNPKKAANWIMGETLYLLKENHM